MKKNLIVKVIAGGLIALAPIASFAATATTTSDYFTVDTREQEQYTIHFDANGGSGSKNDFTIGADLAELVLYPEFSESVDLPGNDGAFEKQGCCFLGWGLSSDVNGVKNGAINSDELVKTTKDLRGRFSANKECTLYAIWGKTCKVRFIGNGGRKEEDSSNEYEHVFVVGKNENLPPNMFKRGNNEFIGWTSVLPVNIDISNKDASSFRRHYIVLDCAEVCFSEMNFPDGNYEYELYALWTVNVSYSFYNSGEYHGVMSDTTSLKPQELGNYLYWRTMADGIWHRSGERVELFPGIHTIQFKRDFNSDTSGYDWYVAFKEDTVTLSVPSYNSYWANWRFGVSAELHEKVDVGMNYSKIGTVCFDCEKEHPNSLVGVDVIPPFSYAKIRIKVYRNYDGSMVSGFECNDFYHLPEGDYVAYPSYGDKNERHGGEKYWDAVSSVPFTVRDGDITRVMINFRLVDDLVWRNTISVYFDYNGAGIDKRKVEYISLWNDQNTAIISQLPKEPMRDSDFCSKDGYYFDGWYTKRAGGIKIVEGSKVTNRTTLYAHWKVVGGGGIERLCEIVRTLAREDDVDTTLQPVSFSQTYTFNSYLQLPDDGCTAGTMTVKTQKERGGVAKATVTIQPAGGKKQTIKGTISTADGTGQGALAGLTFTASGVTGTINGYSVDGAIDASKSKDAAMVAVLNAFKGKSYVMALEPEAATGGNAAMVNGIAGFSIVFSAKGKAKVTGTMPDGTKVSVSSQLIVGSEWCCLPVVYSKTGNSLAFLLWFDREGNFDSVSGMTTWKGKGFEVKWHDDVAVSKVGNLSGTSYFNLEESPTKLGGTSIIKRISPINVEVTPNGAKWDVPKSASVKMDRSGTLVYGANPSALKLTYKAKTGTFSGSVTFYTEAAGRLKKIRATVNGVVVDGVGYGTALVKKEGVWPVVIGPNKIEVAFETAGVVLPSNFVGEYTGFVEDSSKATGNPKWPMERGTLTMSIGADGETRVVIDSILGKVSFSAKGWDSYSNDYGYADVVLMGNGGEQLTLRVRSDLEWYFTELEGSVVGGIFGSTKMTIYGARNRFADSWDTEVKDGVKAFLAKQTGSHRISVSSIDYGGGYPYNWAFGIANEGEDAPLTLTIDDDGTATVSGTLNGRKIEGVTRILFWSAEYYARANFYLQLDAKTECLLSFALYSCYEPWQNIGGEGWMRNIR